MRHKGTQRTLLPPDRVTRTRPHFPCHCGNPDCRAELPKTPAGEPLREQTIEVPKIVADVTEDQWHSVRCPKCQHATQAKPKARQRGMCDPNLIAIFSLLVGVYHLSPRQAARCVGDLLGVELTQAMFSSSHRVRDGTDTREAFQVFVENLRPVFEGHFEGLEALGIRGASGSCTDILEHRAALWTFAYELDVEPSSNHAEQLVRAFVLWRKKTFGSRSEHGDRFAERIMTVVETCRKTDRHVLTFLRDTIEASLQVRALSHAEPVNRHSYRTRERVPHDHCHRTSLAS